MSGWSLALGGLGLAMALADARRGRIPNAVPLGLVALFLLSALIRFPPDRSLVAAAIALAVLAVAFGMFVLRWMPGGDGKALAASCLMIAPGDWPMVAVGFWLLTLLFVLVFLGTRTGPRDPFPLGLPLGLTLVGYAFA